MIKEPKAKRPTEPNSSPQDQQCRLLPPLVQSSRTSQRCREFVENILRSIVPKAQPGRVSAISDQEIEACIDITAVALCWHFSALNNQTRRDEFLEELMNQTFSMVCAIEAGGLALKKSITIGQALSEITDITQLPRVGGASSNLNKFRSLSSAAPWSWIEPVSGARSSPWSAPHSKRAPHRRLSRIRPRHCGSRAARTGPRAQGVDHSARDRRPRLYDPAANRRSLPDDTGRAGKSHGGVTRRPRR